MDSHNKEKSSEDLSTLINSILKKVKEEDRLYQLILDKYRSFEAFEKILYHQLNSSEDILAINTENDQIIKNIVSQSLIISDNVNIGDIIHITQNKVGGHQLKFQDFIYQLTQNFQGRKKEKDYIKTFIKVQQEGYLFIKGHAGVGKSTLLGQTYAELIYEQKHHNQYSDCHFIPYFFQQGAQSNLINNYFQTLKKDLDTIYLTPELEGSTEMDLAADFYRKLKAVSKKLHQQGEKLVFLIDGLDENEKILPHLIHGFFDNVIVIYAGRPTELVEAFEIENVSRYSLIENMVLEGLQEEEIDQLVDQILKPDRAKVFKAVFPTRQLFEETYGNPLHIIVFIKEWAIGGIAAEEGIRIPRIENLYKRIVWRLSKSGRAIEAVRLLCFAHQEISIFNIERVLGLTEDDTQKVRSGIGEVVVEQLGKLRIFHKTFQEYVIKNPETNQNKYEIVLTHFCDQWKSYTEVPTPENIEALEYALEHYSDHLLHLAKINQSNTDTNKYKEELYRLCESQEYKNKQISFFGDFQSSVHLIQNTIKLALHYKEQSRLLSIGISAAEMHILNSNKFSSNIDFITSHPGELQKMLNRIEFQQAQEQFILYINVIHQLLFNDQHPNYQSREALITIVKHLNAVSDASILNWKTFIPDFYMDQMTDQLNQLDIDPSFIDERQQGASKVNFRFIKRLEKHGLAKSFDTIEDTDKAEIKKLNLQLLGVTLWPFYLARMVANIIAMVVLLVKRIYEQAAVNVLQIFEGIIGLGTLATTVYSGIYIYEHYDIRTVYLILIIIAVFFVSGFLIMLLTSMLFEFSGDLVDNYAMRRHPASSDTSDPIDRAHESRQKLRDELKKRFEEVKKTRLFSYYFFLEKKVNKYNEAGQKENLFIWLHRLSANPFDRLNHLAIRYASLGAFKKALKVADKVYKTDKKAYMSVVSGIIQQAPSRSDIVNAILQQINTQIKPISKIDAAGFPSYQEALSLKRGVKKWTRRLAKFSFFIMMIFLLIIVSTFYYLISEYAQGNIYYKGEVHPFISSQHFIMAITRAGFILLGILVLWGGIKWMRKYAQRLNLIHYFRFRSKWKAFFTAKGKPFIIRYKDGRWHIGTILFTSLVLFIITVHFMMRWIGMTTLSSGVWILLFVLSLLYTYGISRLFLKLVYRYPFSFIRPFYLRFLYRDSYLAELIKDLIKKGRVVNALRIYRRVCKKDNFDIAKPEIVQRDIEVQLLKGLFIKYFIQVHGGKVNYGAFQNKNTKVLDRFLRLFSNTRFRHHSIPWNYTFKEELYDAFENVRERKDAYIRLLTSAKNIRTPEFLKGMRLFPGEPGRLRELMDTVKAQPLSDDPLVYSILFFESASRDYYQSATRFLKQVPEREQLSLLKSAQHILSSRQYTALLQYVNQEVEQDTIKAYANQFLFQKAITDHDAAQSVLGFMISQFFRNQEILAQSLFIHYYHLRFTENGQKHNPLINRIRNVIQLNEKA